MKSVDVVQLTTTLRDFAKARDWDQFHSIKNLVMALTVETAELQEIFQWMSQLESDSVMSDPTTRLKVEEEVADVFLYLIRIVDKLGIDLEEVSKNKISKNGVKYPVEKSKGSSKKYDKI